MRSCARSGKFAAAVIFAVPVTAAASWSSLTSRTASAAKQPRQTVSGRIIRGVFTGVTTPLRLSLVPHTVKVGTVVILIRNLDRMEAHRLSVVNVNSPWLPPGTKAAMTVTFKRPGNYTVQTNLLLSESGGAAILQVRK